MSGRALAATSVLMLLLAPSSAIAATIEQRTGLSTTGRSWRRGAKPAT